MNLRQPRRVALAFSSKEAFVEFGGAGGELRDAEEIAGTRSKERFATNLVQLALEIIDEQWIDLDGHRSVAVSWVMEGSSVKPL